MNPIGFIVTTIVLLGASGVFVFGDLFNAKFDAKENSKVLNATTTTESVNKIIKDKVNQQEESGIKKIQDVIENVVETVVESPVLAPILNTKKEVEQTVDTVKSLPVDQRNAICTQICGQQ